VRGACLDALGCDLIQGYMISKPVTAGALLSMLDDAATVQLQAA
jgi:EAL domain-containing protein (putative c-di-GMP-specific phosphodiesterase class I)